MDGSVAACVVAGLARSARQPVVGRPYLGLEGARRPASRATRSTHPALVLLAEPGQRGRVGLGRSGQLGQRGCGRHCRVIELPGAPPWASSPAAARRAAQLARRVSSAASWSAAAVRRSSARGRRPRPRQSRRRGRSSPRPAGGPGCSVLPQTGQPAPCDQAGGQLGRHPVEPRPAARLQPGLPRGLGAVGARAHRVGERRRAGRRAGRGVRPPCCGRPRGPGAATAPGRAATAAWLRSRAASSSARLAASAVEAGREPLRLGVQLDDPALERVGWPRPAGRPRPRLAPGRAAGQPRRGAGGRTEDSSAGAGMRGRARPQDDPSAGPSVPVAGSTSASVGAGGRRGGAGRLELHLQPARPRPPAARTGATARAASATAAAAACSAGRRGQRGQPRLQPGPPGVRLGHQGRRSPGSRPTPRADPRRRPPGSGRPHARPRLLEPEPPPSSRRRPGRGPSAGRRTGCLGQPGQHLRQPLVDLVEGAGGLLPPGHQPALDVGEPAGVEQALEQRPAPLGVGPQEVRELALRQQHHLAELGQGEPEQPADQVPGLVQPGATASASRRPVRSSSSTLACSVVVPLPRCLGRSHAGDRVTRSRRPRRVTSSTTGRPHAVGGVVAAQDRGPCRGRRGPGRRARSRRRPGCWSCRRRSAR